ncbi:hypothetical protein KDA11_03140, partial [Candidatus Saccharibacteria bacterium]|nr:hypothetical protein [Candidatus Saccharibacteria bacterium]
MTSSGNRAQAHQTISNTSPSEIQHRIVTDMFGVDPDHPIAERLQNPEYLSTQLCETAAQVMTVPGYYTTEEINGRKYKISVGNEHFPDYTGKLEETQNQRESEVAGFRLYQELAKKGDQPFKPILLIMNGNLASPFASILPETSSVTRADGINIEGDLEILSGYLDIANSIQKDCIEIKAEAERSESLRSEIRKGKVRKAARFIAGVAVAGAVLAGGTLGTKALVNTYSTNQAEFNAQIAEEEMQQAADEAAAEVEAKQAQTEREEKVIEFDAEYDIESEVITKAGTVALAEASAQFIDVSVPDYAQGDISEKLATDLSAPREVKLTQEQNENCTIVDMPIQQTDSFHVVHDGEAGRAYNVFFDPKADQFVVCDNVMPNNTGAEQ